MKIEISQIVVGDRHRKDMGDLKVLAASIVELGLLQPIGVTSDNTLVFGERRLRACRDILGRDHIEARVIDMPHIVVGENAENEVRKDFTASERVEIARAIQTELGNRRGANQHTKKEDRQNFDNPRSADFAAKRAGFGNHETYRQAESVVETAVPELVEAMDTGKVSIFAAHKAAKETPDTQRKVAVDGGMSLEMRERQRDREMRNRGAAEPLEVKYQTFADSVIDLANTGLSGEEFLAAAPNLTKARCLRSALAALAALRPIVEASSNDQTRTG